MAVLHYRELIAWQKAMDIVEEVYRVTKSFPREEQYGLTNQVRRAAVSIPSNIAEGQGRGVSREFAHHLRISNGSRQEVETQLLIAVRLGYLSEISANPVLDQCAEVGRIISGLHDSFAGN
ncbi:MAG TPA: four helix bundle protein [Tepidisphaeraceae bacterium]|nr:four helix bundle protein [Tepidisphaeraceae bacterium]